MLGTFMFPLGGTAASKCTNRFGTCRMGCRLTQPAFMFPSGGTAAPNCTNMTATCRMGADDQRVTIICVALFEKRLTSRRWTATSAPPALPGTLPPKGGIQSAPALWTVQPRLVGTDEPMSGV